MTSAPSAGSGGKRLASNPTLPTVTGFLTPIMFEKNHEQGGYTNAFSELDISRIVAGYACGNCCAVFSTFTDVCPICHTTRADQLGVGPAPADWQAFYDEHNYGSGTTQTNTIDDALKAIHESPDVEQIPMSKLKPPRFGRGRIKP